MAALFGGVIYLQTHRSISASRHEILARSAVSMADSLAISLERPMVTGDLFTVNEQLRRVREILPEISYAIVRDRNGSILAHTFEGSVPEDLRESDEQVLAAASLLGVLESDQGLIFEAISPILGGHAGKLQLAFSDRMIAKELAALRRTIIWSLILCCALGAGLAAILTHILTRPIQHLVEVADRIRLNDFGAEAEILADDEIGRLGRTFNQMSASLREYRSEVEEKERVRLALLERLVHVQEEERKSISRELHDEVGQSLSAALLSIHQNCKYMSLPGNVCQEMEQRIHELIDDVHSLAWQMRPPILDDYGVSSALQRYLGNVSEQAGLEIDYQASPATGMGTLPSQVELTLYRVAQEAIQNVVRHARANRASVVLLRQDHSLTLLVEDDGCGFEVDKKPADGGIHLGLLGLQERVTLCQGSVTIESAPGSGTTIQIRIPLAEN
jgi:signal transduction histidine kinase